MRIAAANVGSATDASALLGVVTKGLQRLRAEVILQQSVIFVIRILHYSFYGIYIFFLLYFDFLSNYFYVDSFIQLFLFNFIFFRELEMSVQLLIKGKTQEEKQQKVIVTYLILFIRLLKQE